jgi:cob(I)alamin adenosyltransferase
VVELHAAGGITNPTLQKYLNRLSSLLFVLELAENKAGGRSTTFASNDPQETKQ